MYIYSYSFVYKFPSKKKIHNPKTIVNFAKHLILNNLIYQSNLR